MPSYNKSNSDNSIRQNVNENCKILPQSSHRKSKKYVLFTPNQTDWNHQIDVIEAKITDGKTKEHMTILQKTSRNNNASKEHESDGNVVIANRSMVSRDKQIASLYKKSQKQRDKTESSNITAVLSRLW